MDCFDAWRQSDVASLPSGGLSGILAAASVFVQSDMTPVVPGAPSRLAVNLSGGWVIL